MPAGQDPVAPGREHLSARGRATLLLALVVWFAVAWLLHLWSHGSELQIDLFAAFVIWTGALFFLNDGDGRAVRQRLDGLSDLTSRFIWWDLLVLVPFLGWFVARVAADAGNAVVRRSLFAVLAVALVALLWSMSRRERPPVPNRRTLFISIWVFGGSIALLAAGLFAGVTWDLQKSGAIELEPAPTDPAQLGDFYLYYLVRAVPGDLPGTLRWDAPFTYEQTRVGVLILLYNLAVLVPLVDFVRKQLRSRRTPRSAADHP